MRKICKKCGNELQETDKFCAVCGESVECIEEVADEISSEKSMSDESIERKGKGFINDIKNFKSLSKKEKIKKILIFAVCFIVIFTLLGSCSDSSNMSISDFINTYNKISQEEFAKNDMDWEEIDEMDTMEYSAGGYLNEGGVAYAYDYQGFSSSPGSIIFYENEDGQVVSVEFMMNGQFISGNDNFHHIVLDSLLKTFSDASDSEIDDIKSHFGIEERMVGAYFTEDNTGIYEKGDEIYMCMYVDGELHFTMFKESAWNDDYKF